MKVYLQILCLAIFIFFYSSADDKFVFFPIKPPPPCPPFEMYKICLGDCSNCEQRGYCIPSDCSQSGCDCMPHFVRLTPGGPCEPINKCPIPECGENEVFRECGPVCEKCEYLQCRVINCEHKCYCKEGFKRDVNGKCIPMDECPRKECSLQEELKDIGPEDEFCLHADFEKDYGSTQNKTQCYCKEGLKRNTMGHCMDEKFCSVIKCLRHEDYHPCPKKCNTTCRTYGDPNCVEDDQCYPGCFCPEGLLMNDFRRCVKLEDCPPGSNPHVPTLPPQLETTIQKFTTPLDAILTTPSGEGSTIDSGSTTSESEKSIPPVYLKASETKDEIDVEEEEDLPDENVPVATETSKKVMITTPVPKRKPKPPLSGKSRQSKSEQSTSVPSKVPSKPKPKFDEEDIEENL